MWSMRWQKRFVCSGSFSCPLGPLFLFVYGQSFQLPAGLLYVAHTIGVHSAVRSNDTANNVKHIHFLIL